MNCQDLKEEYELYALGLLEGDDRANAEEHVKSGCATCLQSLREAVRLNACVLALAPDVPLPGQLRGKVVSLVNPRRPWRLAPVWAGLAAAALAIAIWTYNRELRLARDLADLQTMLDVLHLPETRQVVFGSGNRQPPGGRVFIHPARGALLLARNLPPAPRGKAYQMWLIPKAGPPKPAGLFQSDQRGLASHYAAGQLEWASAAAVAVSLEPAAGSASPTTTPVIVAPLSD